MTTTEDLAVLRDRLRAATAALRTLPAAGVGAAWNRLIDDVLDPGSAFWASEDLEHAVSTETGMHPLTLRASLRAALDGFRMPTRTVETSHSAEPMAAVLAGNVPVLAPQILLPALMRRRAALIKPATDAPSFTERFVTVLQRNLGLPEPVYVTRSWRGGGKDDEQLARHFDRIAVYGGEAAVRDYAALQRSSDHMAIFGPKLSVGVLSDRATNDLEGLARDVALFEQRGCLSVRVVFLLASRRNSHDLGVELSRALDGLAEALPPSSDLADSSASRHWFDVARLTGRQAFGTPGRSAVVIDEVDAALPPGGRSVSLRPVTERELTAELRGRQRQIQGLAWTGLPSLPAELEDLAASSAWRVAPAGHLQEAGPEWRNDGIDLIAWLG